MRQNIFQQAKAEVDTFKGKVITPEVLEEKRPALKAHIEAEYDTLMQSEYVKTKIAKMIRTRIDEEVFAFFSSKEFKAHVKEVINTLTGGTK